MTHRALGAASSEDANEHTDHDRKQKSGRDKQDRRPDSVTDQRGDRFVKAVRGTEVARGDIADIAAELDEVWVVEAEIFPDLLDELRVARPAFAAMTRAASPGARWTRLKHMTITARINPTLQAILAAICFMSCPPQEGRKAYSASHTSCIGPS